jgi:hypothetical protein
MLIVPVEMTLEQGDDMRGLSHCSELESLWYTMFSTRAVCCGNARKTRFSSTAPKSYRDLSSFRRYDNAFNNERRSASLAAPAGSRNHGATDCRHKRGLDAPRGS